jgi:hypothetical protein
MPEHGRGVFPSRDAVYLLIAEQRKLWTRDRLEVGIRGCHKPLVKSSFHLFFKPRQPGSGLHACILVLISLGSGRVRFL